MGKNSEKPDDISQEDWDSVDVPEWTEEDWAHARPAAEVLPPEILDRLRDTRGQQNDSAKKPIFG